ncbi:MAG: DNA polymerase III subunit delta [Enterobacterales bacterium]
MKINYEKLNIYLNELKINKCYLLFGEDNFLIKECKSLILNQAKLNKFNESLTFVIDMNTDWDEIFISCKNFDLFKLRQIITLILPNHEINSFISNKLINLSNLLHKDLILIIIYPHIAYKEKKSAWFIKFEKLSIYIDCTSLRHLKLYNWIISYSNKIKLKIKHDICNLLCYLYEGNLLELSQILNQLLLECNNNYITYDNIKKLAFDVANFNSFHWIYSVLEGKSERSIHILQKLKQTKLNPIQLLYNIQNELILIILIKQQSINTNIDILFKKYKIYTYKKYLITLIINRLTFIQLNYITSFIIKISIEIQEKNSENIWIYLNKLTLLMCGYNLSAIN